MHIVLSFQIIGHISNNREAFLKTCPSKFMEMDKQMFSYSSRDDGDNQYSITGAFPRKNMFITVGHTWKRRKPPAFPILLDYSIIPHTFCTRHIPTCANSLELFQRNACEVDVLLRGSSNIFLPIPTPAISSYSNLLLIELGLGMKAPFIGGHLRFGKERTCHLCPSPGSNTRTRG